MEFAMEDSPPVFLNKMYDLLLKNELVDVCFRTADRQRISAHRVVLAASSPYFQQMFRTHRKMSSVTEFPFNEITGEVLRKIVDYCYTGRVDDALANLDDMLKAADLLKMSHLQEICSRKLAECLDIDHWFEIYNFADTQNLSTVFCISQQFGLDNFSEIRKKFDLAVLTKKQIGNLLESDDLSVKSEEEVFDALMCWTNSNKIEREIFLPELLPLIRLEQLSIEFLYLNVKEVALNCNCTALLVDAIIWNFKPNLRRKLSLRYLGRQRKSVHKNDFLVAFGGAEENESTFEWYSSSSNVWTTWKFEKEFNASVAVYLDNKVVIIENCITERDAEIWSLNLTYLSFSQLKSLNTPRTDFCAVILNGCIYVLGGRNRNGDALNSTEKYDPTYDTWEDVAPMRYQRFDFTATASNGKIYAIGGSCSVNSEYYNAMSDEWTLFFSVVNRENTSAVALNDLIYVMGGGDPEMELNDTMYRYNPIANLWDRTEYPLKFARIYAAAAVMSNEIFVAGGSIGHAGLFNNSVEKYVLDTKKWREVPPLNNDRGKFSLFTIQSTKLPFL